MKVVVAVLSKLPDRLPIGFGRLPKSRACRERSWEKKRTTPLAGWYQIVKEIKMSLIFIVAKADVAIKFKSIVNYFDSHLKNTLEDVKI